MVRKKKRVVVKQNDAESVDSSKDSQGRVEPQKQPPALAIPKGFRVCPDVKVYCNSIERQVGSGGVISVVGTRFLSGVDFHFLGGD